MSANQFLGLVCRILFILLAVLTAVDYVNKRGVIRRDIALMFNLFGVPLLITGLMEYLGLASVLTNIISAFAMAAEPYLLLRIARHLQPVPQSVMNAARVGMISVLVAIIGSLLFLPALVDVATLVVIFYFIVLNIYTMRVFIRGMSIASGVALQRIRLAALGSGLLAMTFIIALVPLIVPAALDLLIPLALIVLGAAGLCYYVGFAPPRWLRQMWQLNELRAFLLHITAKPMYERLSLNTSIDELCRSVIRAVGGMGSAVIQQQGKDRRLASQIGLEEDALNKMLSVPDGIIERCFKTAAAYSACVSDPISNSDRALLATTGAETMHASPILTTEGVWGVALVFHRSGALFPEDDLHLLNLLTQQSAVFLENSILVDELRSHSGQLESHVDVRTRELKASREQYRRIVETAQEGIWLTDATFKTTFVNQKMADMLGTTPEEMLVTPPQSYLDPEWLGKIDQIKERRSRGVGDQYESKLRRQDGSVLWVLVSAAPLKDESGAVIGSLTMLADISELKQAEQRLLNMNAELEERVASRTADLITVNREMEAFAYSVSHDLRAPLRGIDGFSQALLEDHADQLDEDARGLLNRVRAAAQRMATLIDDLLNLSRISRSEMQWKTVDLSEIAQSVVDEIRQSDPAREVEVVIEPDMIASGDPRLVRVALENLLRNAWKFTRKCDNTRIEVCRMHEHGQNVFAVRDNGAGFDMAYVDKLFGAFQRLHAMTEYEGTGIGLATVQRIIHRHEGRIWAEGAVDQGASFYFTLKSPHMEKD